MPQLRVAMDDPPGDELVNLLLFPRGVLQSVASQLLKHEFGHVRKRAMSDVVEQRRFLNCVRVLRVNLQPLAHFPRNMPHAEGVLESGVHRAWVDQMRHCQLPHLTKPLEYGTIDDVTLR